MVQSTDHVNVSTIPTTPIVCAKMDAREKVMNKTTATLDVVNTLVS